MTHELTDESVRGQTPRAWASSHHAMLRHVETPFLVRSALRRIPNSNTQSHEAAYKSSVKMRVPPAPLRSSLGRSSGADLIEPQLNL